MDEAAQGKISERVHQRYKIKLKACSTAKEMLDKVAQIYQGNTLTTMINARDEFDYLTCQNDEGVEDFLSKIERCRERLAKTTSPISNIEAALKVMRSLPTDWAGFMSSLRAREHLVAYWDAFSHELIKEARLRKNMHKNQAKTDKAAMRAISNGNPLIECTNCQNPVTWLRIAGQNEGGKKARVLDIDGSEQTERRAPRPPRRARSF